jgi:hypothetical protein
MSRLPTPGGDDGQWGNVLNDYILLEHNPDGTHRVVVNPDATTTSKGKIQLAGDLAGTSAAPTVPGLAGKYTLPGSGIPKTDLASAVQASLTTADARDAVKLQGAAVNASAPSDGQVLVYSTGTSSWVPSTASLTVVSDATTGAKGIVQLAGDLGGNASAPTVPGLAGKVDGSVAVAKGDVLVATGSAAVSRVAVGSDTQVLTADSTQATGVKWATPAGGGGGGLSYTFSTKTANYTASNGDYIFADSTASGLTITLPAPAANSMVRVKRLNPAGNSVQVAAPGGSYIDAVAVGTDTLNSQYQGQDYLSDGSNWFRV